MEHSRSTRACGWPYPLQLNRLVPTQVELIELKMSFLVVDWHLYLPQL